MKAILSFLSFPLTVAAVERLSNPKECLEFFENGVDYFPDKVTVNYSKLWSVTYHKTYKILFNQAADVNYLLYQCGTPPPDVDNVIDRGEASFINSTLPIPLGDVALVTTTSIPHMEILCLSEYFKVYLGDTKWISSPCINERIASGDIINVPNPREDGAIWNGFKKTGNANVIGIVIPTHDWITADIDTKVYISAYEEKTNNAIGEWHKVYGILYNREKKATEDFDGISSRFDCTSKNAIFLQSIVANDKPRPKIVWAEFSTSCNAWSVGTCPNLYCEYAEMCAADFLLGEGTVKNSENVWCNGAFTTEEFVEFAKEADIWIYSGHSDYYWDLVYFDYKEDLDKIKAVQNKNVYDTVMTGLNTWYEHRVMEYDLVLEDVCNIVGFLDTSSPYVNKIMRNVFTDSIGDLGICKNFTNAYPLRADKCTILENKQTDISNSYESTTDDDANLSSIDKSRKEAFATAVAVCLTLGSFYAILYFWNNKEILLKRFQINQT